MISTETRLIALLGNPLKQSFSSRMQNAAFSQMDLDYYYFPIETSEESLPFIIAAVRHMNFAGLAVTKPDKIRVMDYLDDVDPLARKMGAVNTVVIRDGRLVGYNTDGEGGVRSIEDKLDAPVGDMTAFFFGAGGAARAMAFTLADRGVRSICLTDILDQASQGLAAELNEHYGEIARSLPSQDTGRVEAVFRASDIVMNCSGLGMAPSLTRTPVRKEAFRPGQLAFDATYNPHKTQFLTDAEEAGARTVNGLGMLVYQGALQFGLWTGLTDLPNEIMFAEARAALAESLSGSK